VKFAKDGAVLLSFAVEPSKSDWNREKLPKEVASDPPAIVDVAVFSDGRIAVADQHFARVVVYDAAGKYLTELGRRGSGEGEFGSLLTIAVDGKDGLYVGDPGLKKIFKYSKDLKPVGKIGNSLPNAGSFLGIRGLAFDPQGRLVASDPPMYTVQAFDAEKLDYLFSYGDETGKATAERNRAYWEIVSPSGIAFDAQGKLYIGQPQNHSVLVREPIKK
jgi:sugar lactone lactonase YvrE